MLGVIAMWFRSKYRTPYSVDLIQTKPHSWVLYLDYKFVYFWSEISKTRVNKSLASEGHGCAKNPVRDLAALVVLEKRSMPKALSDAGSAGREKRAYVMVGFLF